MRIYDIEFDIDSFLDEMEEKQRARRQRQQQIHRGSDVGAEREATALGARRRLTAGVCRGRAAPRASPSKRWPTSSGNGSIGLSTPAIHPEVQMRRHVAPHCRYCRRSRARRPTFTRC